MGDEAGDVFDIDLVELVAAEARQDVPFERPGVELGRARPHGLAVEPVARVLLERLPAGLDSFAASSPRERKLN